MVDEATQHPANSGPAPSHSAEAAAPTEKSPVPGWLDEHGDILWRFVLGRVKRREVAEDIVQETLLAAMQAHKSFAGTSSERTWLLAIASHKVADYYRAARRREGKEPAPGAGESSAENTVVSGMFTARGAWSQKPEAWGLDAGNATENAEITAALRRCMEALPPTLSDAVWLRDILDVPSDEVCKALNITPTNLWSRMYRARAALRACVEKSMGKGGVR